MAFSQDNEALPKSNGYIEAGQEAQKVGKKYFTDSRYTYTFNTLNGTASSNEQPFILPIFSL